MHPVTASLEPSRSKKTQYRQGSPTCGLNSTFEIFISLLENIVILGGSESLIGLCDWFQLERSGKVTYYTKGVKSENAA